MFLAGPSHAANPNAPLQQSQELRMPSKGTLLVLTGLGSAAILSKAFENPGEVAGVLEKSPLEGGIDAADFYGNGIVVGAATAGMMVFGRLGHHDRMQAMGDDLAESMLLAGAVSGVLKLTVDERRPSGGKQSFPSGHTALAFSIAPVVAHHLGWQAGLAAYTVASATGLARMEDRRHYLSDVLFGAAIGVASGREVCRGNGIRAVLQHIRFSGNEFAVSFDF
jgi:hypothetical protein